MFWSRFENLRLLWKYLLSKIANTNNKLKNHIGKVSEGFHDFDRPHQCIMQL